MALCATLAAGYAQADCAEVGYLATFDVKPGQEKQFEAAVLAVAAKVLAVEDGVLLYAPFKGAQEGRYYMMERYRDEQARQAHAKAPEVLALFPPLMEQLAKPLDVQPLSAVCGD